MSNKTAALIGVGLVVIIISAFLLIRNSTKIPHQVLLREGPIIAFGDSLVQGYGSTEGNDFVSDISRDLVLPIINMGKSGDTTAEGLARIDEVLKQKPRVVILLLGGNDVLKRIEKDQTFANLAKIIEKIQAEGAVVILLGVQSGLLSDSYKKDFQNLSEKYKVAYIPNVLKGLIGHKEYMFDSVHPNDVGYAQIAKRVGPVLKDILTP